MKLDKNTVHHLAKLAKMQLSDEETTTIQKELSDILDFVETINELDLNNVQPTSQVTGLEDVMRQDEANYNFEKSDMITTMPDTNDEGFLRVHAVFTEDSPSH